MRVGDYRVIYAYDDRVVHLLTLRRRTEDTYEHLDDIEVRQLQDFQVEPLPRSEAQVVREWEELAKKWAAPRPDHPEPLPEAVTEDMLKNLNIPAEYWPQLLFLTTADGLLDCETVPIKHRDQLLERLCPRANSVQEDATAVVVVQDLVDTKAARVCGPITADGDDGQGHVHQPGQMPDPLIVVWTKEFAPMKPYSGNTARGIAKDAKYTVKLNGTVQLLYYVNNREHALLTTDDHPQLVELVNRAKKDGGSSSPGGGFVINEYRHVLVPTEKNGIVLAGKYTRDLEFAFQGSTITPVASSAIKPGDVWPGPHVGIRYTLTAGAADVRYEVDTPRGTVERVQLSGYHTPSSLAELLAMLRAIKPQGGGIYINEAREIFAPVEDSSGYQRRYVGHLGDRPWFPEPT